MTDTFVSTFIIFSFVLLLLCLGIEYRLYREGKKSKKDRLPTVEENTLILMREIEDKAKSLALFLKDKNNTEIASEASEEVLRPKSHLRLIHGEKDLYQ